MAMALCPHGKPVATRGRAIQPYDDRMGVSDAPQHTRAREGRSSLAEGVPQARKEAQPVLARQATHADRPGPLDTRLVDISDHGRAIHVRQA